MGFLFGKKKQELQRSQEDYIASRKDSFMHEVAWDFDSLVSQNTALMDANTRDNFLFDVSRVYDDEFCQDNFHLHSSSLLRVHDKNFGNFVIVSQNDNFMVFLDDGNNLSNVYSYLNGQVSNSFSNGQGDVYGMEDRFLKTHCFMKDNLQPLTTDNARMIGFPDRDGKAIYSYLDLDSIVNHVDNTIQKSNLCQNLETESTPLRSACNFRTMVDVNETYTDLKERVEQTFNISLGKKTNENAHLFNYNQIDFNEYMQQTSKMYKDFISAGNISQKDLDMIFAAIDSKVMYGRVRSPFSYDVDSQVINNYVLQKGIVPDESYSGGTFRIIPAETIAKAEIQNIMLANEKNYNQRSQDCQAFCATLGVLREDMACKLLEGRPAFMDFNKIKVGVEMYPNGQSEVVIFQQTPQPGFDDVNIHRLNISSIPGRMPNVSIETYDKQSMEYVTNYKRFEHASNGVFSKLLDPGYQSAKDNFASLAYSDGRGVDLHSTEVISAALATKNENYLRSPEDRLEFRAVAAKIDGMGINNGLGLG